MGKLKPINDVPFLHKLFGTTPGDGNMQPKEAIAYSITGFGQNLICTVIGSYLTVFMTDALGFGIGMNVGTVTGLLAVALLMLGTRVFDALNDPIMGSIVDRTRTKWGKCRPYLKWMAVPIGLVTVLCFLPWYPANGGGFAAIAIIYVIWSMVYTVADVPYWDFHRNDQQYGNPRKNAYGCPLGMYGRRGPCYGGSSPDYESVDQ